MSARSLIALTGADRVSFLQGLVSNDVSGPGLTYAALLTPQGKYLADFFVLPQEAALIIDVATSHAAPLAQRLNMYRLRADVQIEESALNVALGDEGLEDPRHPALPRRLYGAQAHSYDPLAVRVQYGIPETGIELTPDTYILEAGFERLDGVDFKKGCYVGQEITARMKHKTELRKGLRQVQITGDAPVGTEILDPSDRAVGTLFSQHEGQALAQLRFDRAKGPMRAGDAAVHWDGQSF